MSFYHLLSFVIISVFVTSTLGHNDHRLSLFRELKSVEISEIMNTTADPCEDYYEFACGNWATRYPASDTNMITGGIRNSISEFGERVSLFLRLRNPTDAASEIKLKSFYQSCLNSHTVKSTEFRNIMKNTTKEFGTMPALEGSKWNSTNFDWVQLVGEIANKYGIGIFLQFQVAVHADLNSYILILLPQKFHLKDASNSSAINEYASTIERNLIKFLGSNRSNAKKIATNIANLEASLVKSADKYLPKFLPVDDFDSLKLPFIDQVKLLNATFGYVPKGAIGISKPGYVEDLAHILKKTPKAAVANYIFYQLLTELNKDFKFKRSPEFCLNQVITHFPMVLSKMTHRLHQLQDTVRDYRELWQDIVTSMELTLEADRLSWYDDEMREFAIEKMHMLKLVVDTFEDYDLDEEHKDLSITPMDYIKNIKAIKSFMAKKMWSKVDKSPDLVADSIDLSTPLYNGNVNVVLLPVTMLLSVFGMISPIPKALKYSRAGFLFGHEIAHAFGGKSRFLDRLGYDAGKIGDVEEEYEERKSCIYNQYKNFEYIKSDRPQQESQSENIADIAGIGLSYHAYMRWLNDASRTEEELRMESLPNVNLTREQLFFVYYSQTWCADYTKKFELTHETDEHTIDTMRAVVPLLNFDEFAKAFQCPEGSFMNPSQKCLLY